MWVTLGDDLPRGVHTPQSEQGGPGQGSTAACPCFRVPIPYVPTKKVIIVRGIGTAVVFNIIA